MEKEVAYVEDFTERNIVHNGKCINVIWDGINVSVEVQDNRAAFVTSVNDSDMSVRGNFSVKFLDSVALQKGFGK